MKEESDQKKPWFRKGLKFQCTECGKCCTGEPGYVWLTKKDITRLAKHLHITEEAFFKKYTRYINGRYSLLETKSNYSCIFYKEKKCQVYSSRPEQCRSYPWWAQNLRSEESWKAAAKFCEGINYQMGKTYSCEEIQRCLKDSS